MSRSGPGPTIWTATAPTRICDAGGWTDTWFARHGRVVSLAVAPRAVATVTSRERRSDRGQVRLRAVDVGDDYEFDIVEPPGRHPLLEQSFVAAAPPDDVMLDVDVSCGAPPGASMGTSASVLVALVGALDAAVTGTARMTAAQAAARAHEIETVRVGRQAGIQDQLSAAHGGVCDIRIDDYPHASVTAIGLASDVVAALDRSLLTFHLGTHDSSAVHREVIDALEGEGQDSPRLARLRDTAARAAQALVAGDLHAYGTALVENTDAQAALAEGVVGAHASRLIEVARSAGAIGWKVNGAGGSGGSVTILCPPGRPHVRTTIEQEAATSAPAVALVATQLTMVGLHVTGQPGDANEGRPEPPLER